jgi:hypothetical protein
MSSIKSSEYLYEITTGEIRVGSKRRGRERERERAVDKRSERWSIGQKIEMAWVGEMAISERGNLSILAKQTNRMNKLSIKR